MQTGLADVLALCMDSCMRGNDTVGEQRMDE
jgi:hypothetical protein